MALDGLVDRRNELAMRGVGLGLVATGALQAAEQRLDLRRVPAVLRALALRAQDPLLLGVNVGHDERIAAARLPRLPPRIAALGLRRLRHEPPDPERRAA